VYRAERRHGEATVCVCFLDFSNAVTTAGFSLAEHVRRYLAPDFYRNAGSLQWNYYFYFVLDEPTFTSFRGSPQARAIEADRVFARKFVRDEQGLCEELVTPLGHPLIGYKPPEDIASRWLSALTGAGLAGIVHPGTSHIKTVRQFLEAPTASAPPADVGGPPVRAANGGFVDAVQLDTFRSYPHERKFEFGTVNLLRGPNGSGKTSLLEAIELAVCGDTRRCVHPPGSRLRVRYRGEERWTAQPRLSTEVYRDRDAAWYGAYYREGNRLCQNFARFNFFDADAAFRLSLADSAETIRKGVEALFLGEFAATLEERIRRLSTRLAGEERRLARVLTRREKELAAAKVDLARLSAVTDSRAAISRQVRARAKAVKWQRLQKQLNLVYVATLREEVQHAVDVVQACIRDVWWLGDPSVSRLRAEAETMASARRQLKALVVTHRRLAQRRAREEQHGAVIAMQLRVAKRLLSYITTPGATSLATDAEAARKLSSRIGRFAEAQNIMGEIHLPSLGEPQTSVAQLLHNNEEQIFQQREAITLLTVSVDQLKHRSGTLGAIVEQVRGLGQRYCEENPPNNECPLCGASHENLARAIATGGRDAATAPELRRLTVELHREQSALVESRRTADELAKVVGAARRVWSEHDVAVSTIDQVAQYFGNLTEQRDRAEAEREQLVGRMARLREAGFSSAEWEQVVGAAAGLRGSRATDLSDPKIVRAMVRRLERSLRRCQERSQKAADENSAAQSEARAIVAGILVERSVEEAIVELQRREAVIKHALSVLGALGHTLRLADGDGLAAIAGSLTGFGKSVDRALESLRRLEERDVFSSRLERRIAELEASIAMLTPMLQRAASAQGFLVTLLAMEYKQNYLQQVVDQHGGMLAAVFSRIHSPREFTSIALANELILERVSGQRATVAEISAGQRTALSLAIALTLNSSVHKRAPWLIFDDPVANVDDLNILSFCDLLRELVLEGGRQVFFATANDKVADLFARKFDCLATEFREIRLER
jgi:DNA repair exonuclease SbcCD ATPase subunit